MLRIFLLVNFFQVIILMAVNLLLAIHLLMMKVVVLILVPLQIQLSLQYLMVSIEFLNLFRHEIIQLNYIDTMRKVRIPYFFVAVSTMVQLAKQCAFMGPAACGDNK